MNVFVTGATGVVGRRAAEQLVRAGHEVTGTARSPEKAALLDRLGARPVQLDVFDVDAATRALTGHDAVVNLLTHIPPLSRAANPRAWRENDRLRVEATRTLAAAAGAAEVPRYVRDSLAFVYVDRGAEWIDEDTPTDAVTVQRTAIQAEGYVRDFTAAGGTGVVLRFGIFQAPEGDHAEALRRAAGRGWSLTLGPPDAYLAIVHADDAASAAVAALGVPAGTYNVVCDEPPTRREYAEALAEAVGADRLRLPPSWVTALAGRTVRAQMRSQRVSNRRLRQASDWAPAYPTAREILKAVVGSR